jgi:hypothetical protein
MRDTAIKGAVKDRAPRLECIDAAEILPEPERDGWQIEPASAASAERGLGVALG